MYVYKQEYYKDIKYNNEQLSSRIVCLVVISYWTYLMETVKRK